VKVSLQTIPLPQKLRGWKRIKGFIRYCASVTLVIEAGRKPKKFESIR